MALNIRRVFGPEGFKALWQQLLSFYYKYVFSHSGSPAIGDGTTAGRLRTNASVTGRVAGTDVTKASTDDLWNLAAETDTTASQYRAYWLFVDAAGTATIGAGSNQASAAAALANLPDLVETKCVFGAYVADPSCDFDDAGGLAAQGTVYNGIPAGAKLPGGTLYSAPQLLTLADP